jgi:hypothetical protein
MNENDISSAIKKEIMSPYVIKLNIDLHFKDVIQTLDEKKIVIRAIN